MGVELVPCIDKGHDVFPEFGNREEMAVAQALVFEDAEPYLNHIQPGRMERHEMYHNAFVWGLEPLAALHLGFER